MSKIKQSSYKISTNGITLVESKNTRTVIKSND